MIRRCAPRCLLFLQTQKVHAMKVLLAGVALAGFLASAADAAVVLAKDGRFEADVSIRQMSRISIQGERIVTVRKLDDPGGPQLQVDTDDKSGDAFIYFDGDVSGRAFTAFITTESGKVVQAVLHPMPGEGQSITVRLESGPAASAALTSAAGPIKLGETASSGASGVGAGSPYQERLVHFIRLMFNDQAGEGVMRRVTAQAALKAGPFSVRETTLWEAPGLVGRVLYVTNIGKADEEVRLEAFLVERVFAAAASHERLRPGEQGRVFIVEEGR